MSAGPAGRGSANDDPAPADDAAGGRHPDFYIVGAAKAGTTSLWNYLRDHPEVHLGPVKEPNFFACGPDGPNVTGPAPPEELRRRLHVDTVTDRDRYLSLFAGAADHQRTGEASVRYLYHPDAPARIAAVRPDARIVIMLRDPVSRLRSHYTMNRGWGLEPLDLPEALAAEDQRVEAGWGWDWHYVRVGLYADQVARYLDRFAAEQVLIVGYDQFGADPAGVVRRVCAHIGVSDRYDPDTAIRAKQAYVPRSRRFEQAWGLARALGGWLPAGVRRRAGAVRHSVNHVPTPELTGPALDAVLARVEPDLARLEALTGRPAPWRSDAGGQPA